MLPTLSPPSHQRLPVRSHHCQSVFIAAIRPVDNPYAMPISSAGYHPQSNPYGGGMMMPMGGGAVPFYNPYSLHPPPEMAMPYMMQGPSTNMNMNMNASMGTGYPHYQHTISSSAAPFYPSSASFQPSSSQPQSSFPQAPSASDYVGDSSGRHSEGSSLAPPSVDANK